MGVYRDKMAAFTPSFRDFFDDPEPYAVDPFRIWGNVYYVGDQKVCMHLVDTGAGLILFDCGYGQTTHMIEASIRKLGFDPADVKLLIVSHGHFDHFGSGNVLRKKYGWTVCMGAYETQLLRERPDRALIAYGPCPNDDVCWPDREIADGETITLGNTSILCLPAPGHTWGTMAFFFEATDGQEKKTVGYWGGAGMLTVYGEQCRMFGLPVGKHIAMGKTIAMLRRHSPEITLGNHPVQNGTLEKRQAMLDAPGTNPFVDFGVWTQMLDRQQKLLDEFNAMGYGE